MGKGTIILLSHMLSLHFNQVQEIIQFFLNLCPKDLARHQKQLVANRVCASRTCHLISVSRPSDFPLSHYCGYCCL